MAPDLLSQGRLLVTVYSYSVRTETVQLQVVLVGGRLCLLLGQCEFSES